MIFVDYYELMQISQNAELPTIQRVYRMQAARYHPDNPRPATPTNLYSFRKPSPC